MADPIQHPAAAGPRTRHRLSVNRVSTAAWPGAAALRVIGLIVLPIAAILAAMPSALAMIIGLNILIVGRLGIG